MPVITVENLPLETRKELYRKSVVWMLENRHSYETSDEMSEAFKVFSLENIEEALTQANS